MLGDKLGETQGRITGTRIVDGAAMEHSVEEQGTLLGQPVVHHVTFTAGPDPAGTLVATGRGLFLTPDGEAASWEARGVVTPRGNGAYAIRAAGVARAQPHGKLARLAAAPVLFEVEVAPGGGLAMKCWAWK